LDFFLHSDPAVLARKLGAFLLTETMDRRPELGFDSYDRFFPNQDTMPKGGLGNLIALPLQKRPRAQGNSVFLDPATLEPWPDQWGFLASIPRMSRETVEDLALQAEQRGRITGVRRVEIEDDADRETPWKATAARNHPNDDLPGPLPESLRLVLSNQIYIAKADLTPPLRNRLLRLTAFQNPEFYKAQAMRMPVYNKPRIICCAEDFPNHIALPRGCLDETLVLLTSNGIRPETTDERNQGTGLDVSFQGQLRPDQQQAADALLANDVGVLCASTAFGKTVVAIHALAQRKVNTLILVHRGQLMDQWVERLSSFLELDPHEIGRIGSGKHKPTGRLDVATIQSLYSDHAVDALVEQYGHVIVDECHHLSARSFESVTRQCKARYFLGLSATVTRQDGHHPIIFMQCGPVRWLVSDREQAARRPFDHRVIVRETEFEPPPAMRESAGWTVQQYYDCLVADAARNDMIVKDVLDALGLGRSPVIITERTAHADYLAAMLEEHCENVILFKGSQGVRQRRLIKQRLEAIAPDAPRVLVATGKYLGEGFDDARLDTLFLALPVSWRGVLAQYAGRLHRLHDGKREVIVYDYADLRVAMLARMFQRRQRGYHAIGYSIGS
jgi:superfamily II DNA or RNA helicase